MNATLFPFKLGWHKCISAMSGMDRLAVYEAIFKYVEEGEEPTGLNEAAHIAFSFIRNDIDELYTRWQDVSVKRAAAANARWSKKKTNNDTASNS